MKVIEAYQCSYCEKLHATEAKVKACEKKCAKTKTTAEQEEAARKARAELKDYVRLNAESVEDICKMSVEISKKLLTDCTLLSMELDVGYTEYASNSHSSPIGLPSNWERKDDKPSGYPALTGVIRMVYDQAPRNSCSDIANLYRLCTGSGGYRGDKGGYQLGYSVTIWLDDFPKIKEKIEQVKQQIQNYEDLKGVLECKFSEEVQSDAYINILKEEVKDINIEISKLNDQAQEKWSEIEVIKSERYKNAKLLTLEQERAKISTEIKGLRPSSASIGEYY